MGKNMEKSQEKKFEADRFIKEIMDICQQYIGHKAKHKDTQLPEQAEQHEFKLLKAKDKNADCKDDMHK